MDARPRRLRRRRRPAGRDQGDRRPARDRAARGRSRPVVLQDHPRLAPRARVPPRGWPLGALRPSAPEASDRAGRALARTRAHPGDPGALAATRLPRRLGHARGQHQPHRLRPDLRGLRPGRERSAVRRGRAAREGRRRRPGRGHHRTAGHRGCREHRAEPGHAAAAGARSCRTPRSPRSRCSPRPGRRTSPPASCSSGCAPRPSRR